ncbi:MAG: hypothetical protein JJ896_01935 [Rhodothermales bacterium]|nr:hypothetical protein [Rhodothermales bacterium]MBO6778388.1 hypothetical protein [Rhodothermales bacterium]
MGWIRHVVIDIAVTLLIAYVAFAGQAWALWVVWIYTGLMLLLKLGAVAGNVPVRSQGVPTWFFHVLYAANVGLLLYAGQLWAAGGWAVIWVLSMIAEARSRPAKAN